MDHIIWPNLSNTCKDGDFKIDDCPLRNSHFLNQKILKFKIENLTNEKFETKILSFEKFTKKTIGKIFDLLYGIYFEVRVKNYWVEITRDDLWPLIRRWSWCNPRNSDLLQSWRTINAKSTIWNTVIQRSDWSDQCRKFSRSWIGSYMAVHEIVGWFWSPRDGSTEHLEFWQRVVKKSYNGYRLYRWDHIFTWSQDCSICLL